MHKIEDSSRLQSGSSSVPGIDGIPPIYAWVCVSARIVLHVRGQTKSYQNANSEAHLPRIENDAYDALYHQPALPLVLLLLLPSIGKRVNIMGGCRAVQQNNMTTKLPLPGAASANL